VQARDTYVHHFDGGHTVLNNRRNLLAAGEKLFFEKHGFFPTDTERSLPAMAVVGAAAIAVNVNRSANTAANGTGNAARVLFLGASRANPLMQLQSLNRVMNNHNTIYYAADTMEELKLDQFGEDVCFQQLDSWYDVETVFEAEVFDAIIYLDDIMKLRNPAKFLSAIYSRLCTNGKLYFLLENSGCLLALNYIIMSRRESPRDAVRLRKNSTASLNDVISMLYSTGFSVDAIEDVFYNETFTYANLDTINNYRGLFKGGDTTNFERIIRTPVHNIIARKPGEVDTTNTLEQLLYSKMRY
jgi:SAM-dependent methyltransferase